MGEANSLIYKGKTFTSVRKLSKLIGISHTALNKLILTYGRSGLKLERAIDNLVSIKTKQWEKTVTINSKVFTSYIDAGKDFGVGPDIIGNWTIENGPNFQIKPADILFNELEKGSWAHLVALTESAGFKRPEDWYSKQRGVPKINTLLSWLKKQNKALLIFLDEFYPNIEFEWWRMKQVPEGTLIDKNRVKQYLKWLEIKLNYSEPEDWYGVKASDFKENYGGSILQYYPSMINIVKILYPFLLDWLFKIKPNGYWSKLENQKLVLEYIADQELFSSLDDWYNISFKDIFSKYRANRLLAEYDGGPDCLAANYPEHNFVFWKFKRSRGYWEKLENQKNYILWLGKTLGIGHPSGWYDVTEQDFEDNYGITLLQLYYGSSIPDCIMSILKDEYTWEKVLFFKNEFKRERRLFVIISCGLPKFTVQFRYRHPLLKHRLSKRPIEFDIFVEELNLAIEYQGRQHYEPVDRFDGPDKRTATERFQHRQLLDQEKREQAQNARLNFWEIKYSDWDGSLDYIIKNLKVQYDLNLEREIILKNASKRGLINEELIFSTD